MNEVWNCKYSKVVQWDGDPQDAPDTCETCDGTGRIYTIPYEKLAICDPGLKGLTRHELGVIIGGEPGLSDPLLAVLSTDHLPDDIECPECQGYGQVYYE